MVYICYLSYKSVDVICQAPIETPPKATHRSGASEGILAPETGKFAMAAVAFVGAALVILVQRKVWHVPA
jgi:hypothetical protein